MYKPKYFNESEFHNVGCNLGDMDPNLLRKIDELRERFGGPLTITSAYRTQKQNEAAGGAKSSAHLRGTAVDLRCRSNADRYRLVTAALAVGFHRIGIGKTFVHVDVDPINPPEVIWLY